MPHICVDTNARGRAKRLQRFGICSLQIAASSLVCWKTPRPFDPSKLDRGRQVVCLDCTITGHFQSIWIVGVFSQISLEHSSSHIEIASRNQSTRSSRFSPKTWESAACEPLLGSSAPTSGCVS